MQFQYDLSQDIASSDFFSWLVIAAAEGATEIVFRIDRGFKTNKWPAHITQRRFETLLWPGPAFLGLSAKIGIGGRRISFQPSAAELVRFCRSGQKFPRLRTVLPPGSARYTVTLRRDWRRPEKNSNDAAWQAFANEIGATIIEDYDVQPRHPHDIMALYAGAEMNFGVNSGQFWLAALSDYPYMVFDCSNPGGSIANYFPKYGVPVGGKWPWFNQRQHIIWMPDSLENLRCYFAIWKKANEKLGPAAA